VACCPAADLAHGVRAHSRYTPNVRLREGFDARAWSIGQRLFHGALGLFAQIGQVNGVIHALWIAIAR
jgi:hypothetical protein